MIHKHGAISISCLEGVLVGNEILALSAKGFICKRLSTPSYYIAVLSSITFGKQKGEFLACLKKNKLLRVRHLTVINEQAHIHFHIHLLILSVLNIQICVIVFVTALDVYRSLLHYFS